MKKLNLLIAAMALVIFSGCSGVMNQHDRDAAIAHSTAQRAVIEALMAQQGKPLCEVEFVEGVPVTGLKSVKCAAPVNLSGIPEIKQYVQPEHPAKAIAAGVGNALSGLPTAIVTGVLGYTGIKALEKGIEKAGTSTATTYNQAISGTGNTAQVRTVGNVQMGNVTGDGNVLGGLIDQTSPPSVTIVEQPAPIVVPVPITTP